MKPKIASILLLAWVCLAGIAVLAIAQPVSVVTSTNGTASNQTVNITSHYPVELEINDIERAVRTFNITINQPVNVSWLINGTEVFNQSGVNFSEYNASAVPGYWNVTTYAYNENGSDMRTWWWTVNLTANDTSPPTVIDYAPTGTKVSIKTDVTATFSEAMNSSTLNNATISVCNSSGSTVAGLITCDSETNTTVTFDPLNELEYNETYHVTITTGVQDLAGNNMSYNHSWNFTTRSEILRNPIVISGCVAGENNMPILNPTVCITNLNTNESFWVETHANESYYRMQTDSTHVRAGDTLRFSVSDGESYCTVINRTITEEDIESGGFQQNFDYRPDLVIISESETFNSYDGTLSVSYTVMNIGDGNATESNTTIYVDGVPKKIDPVGPLAPDEYYSNTVVVYRTFDKRNTTIKVCADSDDAVDERFEDNNCLENEFECTALPNLKTCQYCNIEGPDDSGRFKIALFDIVNCGDSYACQCNATISITNVSVNGTVSDVVVKDRIKPLGPHSHTCHRGSAGPFVCAPNRWVKVRICADGDDEILESDETDNCYDVKPFLCPASACKPDLMIDSISRTWINRTNKTFSITYTVKNDGTGNANASMTHIVGGTKDILDPVPALAPGESYTSTLDGPFYIPGYITTINICTDYYGVVNESDEDNNCWGYRVGVPYLELWKGKAYWVSGEDKTFNICYEIYNNPKKGMGRSNVSTLSVYLDGNLTMTDTIPELDPVWFHPAYKGTIGPLTMPEGKDVTDVVSYRLCLKYEHGETCKGGTFGGGACVGDDGYIVSCGGSFGAWTGPPPVISKSCTLTGDMYCPKGIRVGSSNIVIDGNGSGILGDRSRYYYDKPPYYIHTRAGIYNDGHDNVTIKNMDIRNYYIGITIVGADNNTVENCLVHDNGAVDKYTYGIAVVGSNHTTIEGCEVYNNIGKPTGENVAGGHGINFERGSNYCVVTNSHIFHNYLSGILASPSCKYLYIGNNTIEDNGYCNESGFCAGINLHWRGGFGQITNSTVENNVIVNNTGSGIYVAQGYTAIKNNTVRGSKKNDSDLNVNGYGILIDGGRVTFLYNNTCCENEGADIVNSVNSFATFGDDNTCDVTDNYNDEGTRGCNFYCGGVNGACIGDVTGKVFRCGDVVTESCTFNRSMSCRGCSARYGYGLIAGADNITIDGAGYALTGNFSGIGILCNHSGVKIKNLQVEDFSTGMEIENTGEVLIENCTVRTNLLTGINFSADNGTVRNSRIYDNFGPGIFVGGANSVFENNTVAKNRNGTLPGYPGYGIYFSPDAKGNSLTTNFIGDNEYYDIYNKDGASNYNLSDNNTCDIAFNYWDASMLKDKKYNCTYAWTPPDLIISNKYEEWVDEKNATYNVTYTIENIGVPESRLAERSFTYLYIWGAHAATDPVPPLNASENYTSTFGYTPTMLRDEDRIKVCADGANEVEENNPANKFYYKDDEWYRDGIEELLELEDHEANNCLGNVFYKNLVEIKWNVSAACVATDGSGTEYRCGDIVEKSCTFNGNMPCPSGHGLIIGASGITIDGAGFAIGRDAPASSCAGVSEGNPGGGDCGIYNPGYDYVKITNLEILHFCNGIGLDGSSDVVVGNIIENCKIHDNGNSMGRSHGIHMVRVKDTTIRNNDIHHNKGTGDSCGDGGNGIFLYAGNIKNANNTIVDNDLHDNDRAGFWTKMGMNGCTIKNNRIWGNSIGSGLGDMTGGLVLQCVKSNHNTIEDNEVWANHGRGGIFIGGNDNIIRKNNVHDNKGDGIFMGGRDNTLDNNVVCDNEGVDIRTCGEEYGNSGDENRCDTTENYNDTGTTGCMYPCSGRLLPDLVITEIRGAWVSEEDRTYNVTYTVKNIGTADANKSTTRIQILGGDSHTDEVPALKPGKSHTHTFGPFTLPPSRTCDEITITADMLNAVTESNEENNTKVYYFPPVLDKIIVSPSTARLEVGDTQVFTATAYDKNGDPMQGIIITWSSSDKEVGDVSPKSGITDGNGNATTVFTANHVGTITITAAGTREDGTQISGHATVKVWFKEPEKPEVPSFVRPGGGGRPPAGEENITGYEPGPGEGGGERSVGEGKEAPINETNKSVSGGKTKEISGYRIGPKGLEILVENVKVVAPVFLIIMVVIFVVLFYSGYFGEKRAHRRKNKNNRRNR